ncbi:hypothetical protein VNO77_24435 [Canavalia gladiata]|uniref:Uncharacterized protein n=1 Tax=Canavalia gladiata TaxID=3824 RepID=A0AAN9L8S9_CANGL
MVKDVFSSNCNLGYIIEMSQFSMNKELRALLCFWAMAWGLIIAELRFDNQSSAFRICYTGVVLVELLAEEWLGSVHSHFNVGDYRAPM